MQLNQRSWELRQVIAVVGILLSGIVAALTLPIWMAAICLLGCLSALRIIALSASTILEPVVIPRDEHR